MCGVTLRSRWIKGGAAYILLVMALGTAAAVDVDSSGFYIAAIVATIPSYWILYPAIFSIQVFTAMIAGVGVDGSGPAWVLVPLLPLSFGACAAMNVLLLWLVMRGARPCAARLRLLFSRA